MARLTQVVFDARHPASLARFWAAALDGFEVRGYDDEELARLARLGRSVETDPIVVLDGPGLELCFQEVTPAECRKTPVHLDMQTPDRRAEVARLIALGAVVERELEAHTWMRDPEGNDFCIVDAR